MCVCVRVCVRVCVCVSVCVTFSFIHYNDYNTVIKHVNTPVPTMDNRLIQIDITGYAYIICEKVQTYRQPYRVGQSIS